MSEPRAARPWHLVGTRWRSKWGGAGLEVAAISGGKSGSDGVARLRVRKLPPGRQSSRYMAVSYLQSHYERTDERPAESAMTSD